MTGARVKWIKIFRARSHEGISLLEEVGVLEHLGQEMAGYATGEVFSCPRLWASGSRIWTAAGML